MSIKSIDDLAEWSELDIKTLSYGGNTRLDEFLSPYLVYLDMSKHAINVTNLNATKFYRQRLAAFVKSGKFDLKPPSLESGTKFTTSLEQHSPEGMNVVSISEDNGLADHKAEKLAQIKDNDADMFDSLDENLKDFIETTGDIFSEQSKAAWDSTSEFRQKTSTAFSGAWDVISNKTKTAFDKTGDFAKESWDKTGDFAKEKWERTKSLTKPDISDKENKEEGGFKKLFTWFSSPSDQPKAKIEEEKSDGLAQYAQGSDSADDAPVEQITA